MMIFREAEDGGRGFGDGAVVVEADAKEGDGGRREEKDRRRREEKEKRCGETEEREAWQSGAGSERDGSEVREEAWFGILFVVLQETRSL